MIDEQLERLVEQKIKPLLEDAMHTKLGITITELESDISDKLKKSSLLDFEINTNLKFKQAKKKFKKEYVAKLLQLNFGNVADVAKFANVDRRSIHRFIAEMKIEVEKFRDIMQKGKYVKRLAVQDIIQDSLEQYKSALSLDRYKAFYAEAPQLSEDISKELPEKPATLKEAELEFEKMYFEKALEENKWNISKTARKIGLRFETLHRKLKVLGIKRGS
ncbi:hypothetical protein COV18_05815 [Candidatus Woesearchaeota archaeon CG10_big_fil_rev_8_21_14_0_10_37_12]|nr:MAG: hypothetical protein COV18_05815 [Candidatus Woesearchaeota archaeon CG10_big_fil_rev_8_21_14_0_10_37_12]